MLHDASVTSNYRLQHRAPAIGAMDVARPQHTPLDIAELVEHEQRMITGAGKMAIHMGMFEVKSHFRSSWLVLRLLFRIQGLSPFHGCERYRVYGSIYMILPQNT